MKILADESMGTVLEGERNEVIEAVEAMNEAIFAAGALRVGTALKIDERRDKPASIEHMILSWLRLCRWSAMCVKV